MLCMDSSLFLLISVETRTVINHAVNGRKYKIIYVKTSRPLITSIVQPDNKQLLLVFT